MKVLIADPLPKVRHALTTWMSNQPGWEIVGEAGCAVDLLNRLEQLSTGVVIVDRDLPGLPAEELLARVRQVSNSIAIILLAPTPFECHQADTLDADFYVSKVDPPECMLNAVLEARNRLEGTTEEEQLYKSR